MNEDMMNDEWRYDIYKEKRDEKNLKNMNHYKV